MSKKLPNIQTHFSDWYNTVVYDSELADQSPVRGCIVIRPYGYSLWEHIKKILNDKIIATGHKNVAFPLLIPHSFLEKEAEHVEGFAPEIAVVTHAGGKKLEEPYVIRPTSETIVHYMFAKWIKSWRDLPLKLNQWANVIRWEKRTRPFLRTSEFFWQEGHTAHETAQEAEDEAQLMLDEYTDVIQNYLAIPLIIGIKSESEKFAGAEKTHTMEAMMQDGKALQMGTSHVISRSFAKAFGIEYQNRDGKLEHPYLTSWGITTRLIGAIVGVHGDQKGLILPPRVAPIQVIIIPIFKSEDEKEAIKKAAQEIKEKLTNIARVEIDDEEQVSPGAKFYKWELKGVPVRVEIGPRDLANGTVVVADRLGLVKETVTMEELDRAVQGRLELVHKELFKRAEEHLKAHVYKKEKLVEFGKELAEKGGFYQTGWCRSEQCENKLKEYKATTRCLLKEKTFDICFGCDSPSVSDIIVAKSY